MSPNTARRPVLAVLLAGACLALSAGAATAGPAPGARIVAGAALAETDAAGAAAGGPAPAGSPSAPAAGSPGLLDRRAEGDYRWPTGAEADLVRDFDAPKDPWGAGHRGVDLELAAGSPVHSAADGVVVFAGTVVDRPVVSVEHPDGVRTTYEPVAPTVVAGQRVLAGDVLGHLEAGHCPPWELTTCLHWGARTSAKTYLDPMDLLGVEVVVRLLPATMDLAG